MQNERGRSVANAYTRLTAVWLFYKIHFRKRLRFDVVAEQKGGL